MLTEKAITMMRHIKHTTGSDLDLGGVSGGFSVFIEPPKCPTGDSVAKGSYERPDAHVLLSDGRELHVVSGKNKKLKLTLVKDDSAPSPETPHLWWVDTKTMRDAIDCGVLHIEQQVLEFANTRPLKRMLARAGLAGAS